MTSIQFKADLQERYEVRTLSRRRLFDRSGRRDRSVVRRGMPDSQRCWSAARCRRYRCDATQGAQGEPPGLFRSDGAEPASYAFDA